MRIQAALAVLLTIGSTAALAQDHSAEDEAACTPDVMRLCQEFIPSRQAIIACMVQKKSQLSAECNAVFSRPPAARAVEGERQRRNRPDRYAPN